MQTYKKNKGTNRKNTMGKRLTERQIEVLRELVNFKCESCKGPESRVGKLIPHRLKRGYIGGEYIPRNIQMICFDCHRIFHGGEFKW